MASWDDVDTIASGLGAEMSATRGIHAWEGPGTGLWTGPGTGGKSVKLVVWERPLRPRDVAEVGTQDGPVIAARIADEGEKAALIAENPRTFFTTSHFNGWPAILIRLDRIGVERLSEVIENAWLVSTEPPTGPTTGG